MDFQPIGPADWITPDKFLVVNKAQTLTADEKSLAAANLGLSQYTLPPASYSFLGGVIAGAGLTIETNGRLHVRWEDIPAATNTDRGGVMIQDGLLVGDRGEVMVDWDAMPATVFRTDQANIVTGLASFTQPVTIANATSDGHAVNLASLKNGNLAARLRTLSVYEQDQGSTISLDRHGDTYMGYNEANNEFYVQSYSGAGLAFRTNGTASFTLAAGERIKVSDADGVTTQSVAYLADIAPVAWSQVPGNVFRTDQANIVTGLASFTQPVSVAAPTGDGHAVNQGILRRLAAMEYQSAPWTYLNYAGRSTPPTCLGNTMVLKKDATYAARFVFDDHSRDADVFPHTLILGRSIGHNPGFYTSTRHFHPVGMGYCRHGGEDQTVCPKVGDGFSDTSPFGFAGHVISYSPQQSPDGCFRVASLGMATRIPGAAHGGHVVQGLCILPMETTRLIYHHPWQDTYGMEAGIYGTMVFALDVYGTLYHLVNFIHMYGSDDDPHPGTFVNGYTCRPLFLLGYQPTSYDGEPERAWGLDMSSKGYIYADPLNLPASACILKNIYTFIAPDRSASGNKLSGSRWDVDGSAHTVTAVWDQAGRVTPSTVYPSSTGLGISVAADGITVTIEVPPNNTGAARQLMANFQPTTSGLAPAYTILINQAA